jgi:hypothetical protein
MLNCRIWPNGEFSVWEEKKTLEVEPPPVDPDLLGLSLLPISHRVALGMADPPKTRAQRGLKGISRHAARMTRNAAFLLEQKYPLKRLGFYTMTLPRVSDTSDYAAAKEWAEIVRIFLQTITRLLAASGLPTSYVGCTEIQEGRYAKYGGLPLHLHIVVVGRKYERGKWAIHSDQWRAAWRSAVLARCPEFSEVSFRASVDTVEVKKSAAGYLGKYMSKGVAALSAILSDDPGLAEFMPRSWSHCSLKLRRAVGARIAGGNDSARRLMRDIRTSNTRVDFAREIKIEMSPGIVVPVAVVGSLSAEGRARYCHAWHLRPIQGGRVP